MRPGPAVLASFGAQRRSRPAARRRGTAWRAGEIVLKPAGDPRVARWTAGLYRDWAPWTPAAVGSRLPRPRPLRAATAGRLGGRGPGGRRLGGLAVAARRARVLGGVSPFWPRLIAASRAFHAALAGRPAPPWLGRDGSPWTVGDQVAWGERDPGSVLAAAPAPLGGQLRSLLAALRPVRLPAQLIHGDLGGNVLFADGRAARRDRLLALLAARRAGPGRRRGGRADVGRGRARPSSMSWPASRNWTSCWPARWCTGSSPRSSSGAATRTRPRDGRADQPAGDRPGPGPPGLKVRIR